MRARRLADLQWSEEQVGVMVRAERLHEFGMRDAAAYLVASGVEWPGEWFRHTDFAAALNLDLPRWYFAFTGRTWDGSVAAMSAARTRAASLRRGGARPRATGRRGVQGGPVFRSSHLLVDPLDAHPDLDALRDYTRYVGWPERHDAGCLEWDNA